MAGKFIPYQCKKCIFGEYCPDDDFWDSGCDAKSDEECEELFAEDCSTELVLADLDSEV